jgi:hypothetical protein
MTKVCLTSDKNGHNDLYLTDCRHTRTHTHAHTHTHALTHTYTYTHTCTHTRAHTHTCTQTHTCTHTTVHQGQDKIEKDVFPETDNKTYQADTAHTQNLLPHIKVG